MIYDPRTNELSRDEARLYLADSDNRPLARCHVRIQTDDLTIDEMTDDEGGVILPEATLERGGSLIVEETGDQVLLVSDDSLWDEEEAENDLDVRRLHAILEEELANDEVRLAEAWDPWTVASLCRFQEAHHLPVTGELDDTTCHELADLEK